MAAVSIAVVTDAWTPQVNGVVNTLQQTRQTLVALGHTVEVLSVQEHRTLPCPTYPEIRLAILPYRAVARRLERLAPDHIHIATEGPLGLAARRYCLRNALEFTTSYHTQFPEYLRRRIPVPLPVSYALVRRFHRAAACTLVATPSQERRLRRWRFRNLARWSRGVDTTLFRPDERQELGLARPVFAYAGRIAVEKNLTAFLDLDLPGSKCVIGDGPALAELRRRYPRAMFAGYRFGAELARYLAAADVFVFPSLTDTFGLVLLEAMACGVPVAAYPVTGPVDVVQQGAGGILDADLGRAAMAALELPREHVRACAMRFSWEAASLQFLGNLVPVRGREYGAGIATRTP